MTYEILAIGVDYNNGEPIELRVAILSNGPGNRWKAYKSNNKPTAGYPLHDIRTLSEKTIQEVAASGLKMSKKDAIKFFRGLSPMRCENE
jgi:hypothetical protein